MEVALFVGKYYHLYERKRCKYFSQEWLLRNLLYINVLQNLFVLHGKSVGFASQKSRFRNVKAQLSLFNRIIFTKLGRRTLTI
ncbi:hypothetical protein D2S45_11320 [Prevotella intermedia]|uniref:Uncharacterized protein n=1 Tax=Prevotella intermedia TaxID=28131 RepID=A0A3R8G4J6_PREIN|nr:hypothetical protein D2S45_11320 [Prevotella intermedia]